MQVTRSLARGTVLPPYVSLLLTSEPPAPQAQELASVASAAHDSPEAGSSISGRVATVAHVSVSGVTVAAALVGKPRIILQPGIIGTERTKNATSGCDPTGSPRLTSGRPLWA